MQAILITAYKDFEYLDYLINSLRDEEVYIYIHVDKRYYHLWNLEKYDNNSHIKIISTRKIVWGSIEHVYAIIDLINEALKNKNEFFYFHIITGQDYMHKSMKKFKKFFNKNNKKNYMSCNKSNKTTSFRYKKYYRNDLINYKTKIGNFVTKLLYFVQKILFINRKPSMTMYKGLIYVSITNDFTKYIISYINSDEGKKFLEYLKWCFIPEEFFFQTILMNSHFKDSLVNNNLRFFLWKEKHGTQPGILDIEDVDNIELSKTFFIRKISLKYSKELLDYLKKKEKTNGN